MCFLYHFIAWIDLFSTENSNENVRLLQLKRQINLVWPCYDVTTLICTYCYLYHMYCINTMYIIVVVDIFILTVQLNHEQLHCSQASGHLYNYI